MTLKIHSNHWKNNLAFAPRKDSEKKTKNETKNVFQPKPKMCFNFVLKLNRKRTNSDRKFETKNGFKKRDQKSTKCLFFFFAGRTLPTIPVAIKAGRTGNTRNVNHQFLQNTMSNYSFLPPVDAHVSTLPRTC